MTDSNSNHNAEKQALLNQIVLEWMNEQKYRRRFRWIMYIIILVLILILLIKIGFSDDKAVGGVKPHAGMIDVSGIIMDADPGSAENFAKGLESAYKNSALKALIVKINSPGGSPVQADYIYSFIQYYRKRHPDVKVYAVCVDMCASAAYYIAAGADEIYANPASLVGSIGVLYNGFGFVDTLDKLGMTRRLQTAGRNKDFLDPFSPEKPEDKQHMQVMLDGIHSQFINRVKEGRGDRLKVDNETFSGLFWIGTQAKERGLIDGFASAEEVARDIVQVNVLVDYTYRQNWLDRLSKNIGAEAAARLPAALGLRAGFQ